MNERARGRPPAASAGGRDRFLCMRKEGCARDDRGDGEERAGPERTDRGTDRTNHGFKRDVPHSSRSCQSACPIVWSIMRFSTATASRVYNVQKRILVNFLPWSTSSVESQRPRRRRRTTRRGEVARRSASCRRSPLADRRSLLTDRGSSDDRDLSARDMQPLFIAF